MDVFQRALADLVILDLLLPLDISGPRIQLGQSQSVRGAERIKLTTTERSLLDPLVRKPGQAITRWKILESIWVASSDHHADPVDPADRA